MNAPQNSRALIALTLAFSVGGAIAHLSTSGSPFVIGSLIDGYGFSATGAGLVAFCQIGALAGSMILVSALANRFSPLRLCLCGAAVSIVSSALMYEAHSSLALMCSLGILLGVGYGLLLTAAVSAAAATPQPDRIYAIGTSGTLLLIVPMLSVLPVANRELGPRGTFLAISGVIIICVPLLFGFRARQVGRSPVSGASATFVRPLSLLAIWSLLSFGTGAMWAFTERIGIARGLPSPIVGWVLSVSPFSGLIGTGLAGMWGNRLSRPLALALGLIGSGLACLTFMLARSESMFAVAAVLYWVSTMFAYVLLLGTAAQLDASGRLGTLGTGCERFAFAISAPAGGMLVDFGSLTHMGIIATASCSVVALSFLPKLRKILHKTEVSDNAPTRRRAATLLPP
jgi:predicted MFS family arabinose efflux permease